VLKIHVCDACFQGGVAGTNLGEKVEKERRKDEMGRDGRHERKEGRKEMLL